MHTFFFFPTDTGVLHKTPRGFMHTYIHRYAHFGFFPEDIRGVSQRLPLNGFHKAPSTFEELHKHTFTHFSFFFLSSAMAELTGGSHLSHTVVKLDSCLSQIFCQKWFFSFSLHNLM